jgi:hypothetical protein
MIRPLRQGATPACGREGEHIAAELQEYDFVSLTERTETQRRILDMENQRGIDSPYKVSSL